MDTATDASGFLGWDVVDVPMLLCLPALLLLSGFFSGSETALFGLSAAQRQAMGERNSIAARAVEALLANHRMLLITVLLGNMTVNVLYFVISSVLMMRCSAGPLARAGLSVVVLLLIVIAGEVGPKILANAARERFLAACAPLLFTFHRAIAPLRLVLDGAVVAPLSRLTAPHAPPPELGNEELRALVEVAEDRGDIDEEEERMLREVLRMRRLRVREVMTPRLDMVAIPAGASRQRVREIARLHRLTRVPVYVGDLDHVAGVLHVRRFLLGPAARSVTDPAALEPARYVPDLSSLEQLLDHLRRWRRKSAIVVDEFGGTEGVVSVEDVVEELVGDIVGRAEPLAAAPQQIGPATWRVAGRLEAARFAERFGVALPAGHAATVGVLVAERLGRTPQAGDAIRLGPLEVAVETVRRRRVASLLVTLAGDAAGDGEEGSGA